MCCSESVLERLGKVITDSFGVDDIEITRETLASDIPGWDSLSHTLLMCCIEQHFDIAVDTKRSYANIGELADSIELLLGSCRS